MTWREERDLELAEANPYLHDFLVLCDHHICTHDWHYGGGGFCDDNADVWGSSYNWQRELRDLYGYAIPSEDAIDRLARLSPIVEIGAGNGYWAHVLSRAGADVVAYDVALGRRNRWVDGERRWFDVQYGDEFAASRHPDRTLLLCWPPYNRPMAYDAARHHRAFGGKRLAYVGESWGCTACDRFHAFVDEECESIGGAGIPQWYGLHDKVSVYEYKEVPE